MTALENAPAQKLEDVFRAVFELSGGEDVRRLQQGGHPKWDSLGHAMLIAAIESEFGVSIDTAEAIELKTFEAARHWLESSGASSASAS